MERDAKCTENIDDYRLTASEEELFAQESLDSVQSNVIIFLLVACNYMIGFLFSLTYPFYPKEAG